VRFVDQLYFAAKSLRKNVVKPPDYLTEDDKPLFHRWQVSTFDEFCQTDFFFLQASAMINPDASF
jgi:hypothetical protein